MNKITTSLVVIEHSPTGPAKDLVQITHRDTGMVTTTTLKQLENWSLRQLRGALTPSKVSA